MVYKSVLFMVVVLIFVQCKSTTPASGTESQATLLNTYWRLSEMNGEPVRTAADAKEAHIILSGADQEFRIKGFAGCNNIGGGFEQRGQKLTITAFSTKMMCPPHQMKIEDFLLKALSLTDHYEIKGETLLLLQGGTVLAKFESVYLK